MTPAQKDMICSEVETLGGYQKFISLEQLRNLVKGDELLEELLDELVSLAIKYTETVLRFQEIALQGNKDFLLEIDIVRKRTHDAFNDSVNILTRMLGKAGKNNSWSDTMTHRAVRGKFALILTFHWLKEQP